MLQNEAVQLYAQAIGVCHKLFRLTNNKNYLKIAFSFSEKNKAIVLAESLKALNTSDLHEVTELVVEKEKSLKQQITLAEQKLNESPEDSVVAKKVFQLKWSYDSLVQQLAATYPKYFDLKHNLDVVELEKVQAELSNGQTVLSYFQTDSIWYIFSITSSDITLHPVSTTAQTMTATSQTHLTILVHGHYQADQ